MPKKKVGRPTEYRSEFHDVRAFEFCEEFGFVDKQLAKIFDVSEQTINAWKKEHPIFLESIRAGKDNFDSASIEKSLRRRAEGIDYTETTRELRDTPKGLFNSEETSQLVVTKEVDKFISPDTKAIEFWLRNRKNKRWPDKHELNIGGDLGVNVNDMTDKRKEEVEALAVLRSQLAVKELRKNGDS